MAACQDGYYFPIEKNHLLYHCAVVFTVQW